MPNHSSVPNKLSQRSKIIIPADDNSLSDINVNDEAIEVSKSYRSDFVACKVTAEHSGDFDESFTRESRHSHSEPSM